MRIGTFGKKFVSWIACCAILMGSIAPTISHAMQSGSGNRFAEICTSLGVDIVRSAESGAAKSNPAAPATHPMEHCPYCSMHAPLLGLPPAPLAALPLLPRAFGLPALFLSAPRLLHAWVSAQPRAPPHSA